MQQEVENMKSDCPRLLLIDQLIGYQMRGKIRKWCRHKLTACAEMKINSSLLSSPAISRLNC